MKHRIFFFFCYFNNINLFLLNKEYIFLFLKIILLNNFIVFQLKFFFLINIIYFNNINLRYLSNCIVLSFTFEVPKRDPSEPETNSNLNVLYHDIAHYFLCLCKQQDHNQIYLTYIK